jgi:undecaprenyl-diphosphatase
MRNDLVLILAGKRLFVSLGIAFILLATFALIAWQYPQLTDFDQRVTLYVQSFRSTGLTQCMTVITHLGSAAVTIAIALSLLLYAHAYNPKFLAEVRVLAICLSGSWLTNEALKAFFQRARPDAPALVSASGYSFPSGHAMISFAFYGLLGYLLWQYGRRQPGLTVRLGALVAWLLAITIGISRIYLGVHFPSDVIAGYAAGGVWLTGCVMVLFIIHHRQAQLPRD